MKNTFNIAKDKIIYDYDLQKYHNVHVHGALDYMLNKNINALDLYRAFQAKGTEINRELKAEK